MNITGLEFCRSTGPSPFLGVLVCRVVELLGLKYILWIRAETPCIPLVSKEGNSWKSELHLVWVQSQCVLPTYIQEIHQVLVMFLVISSIDDHVISYACNSRNTEENCIQFPLEHVLCNNGTHLKSCSLKFSNVQSHCCVFP